MLDLNYANTDLLYKGCTDILQSKYGRFSRGAHYWRDTVMDRPFEVHDYNDYLLNNAPQSVAGRRELLQRGFAYIGIRNPYGNVPEGGVKFDYHIFRPGDLSKGGAFIINEVRKSWSQELMPNPDQRIVYDFSQKTVIPDPFSEDFLRGIYERIQELTGRHL